MGAVCSACAGEERPGREGNAPPPEAHPANEMTPLQMSNAEKIKVLKRASMTAKGYGAKYAVWLTDAECEEWGMPMLCTLEHLRTPPFVWDGFRTLKTSQWELVYFPWTALKAQQLMKDRGITLLTDPSSVSMPAKIVNHLTHGETYFGYESDEEKVLERVTPVLCVRVFEPSGKFLVQCRTAMLREGYYDGAGGDDSLDIDEMKRWPGKACAEPKDVITEAELLMNERAGIPIDALICSCGEITLSPPHNDRFLSMKSRIVSHFVNAQLKQPVSDPIKAKLGIAEGKCTHQLGTQEFADFEWWDVDRCETELPGEPGACKAFSESPTNAEEDSEAQQRTRRTFHVQDLLNGMRLEQPWDPSTIQRILKQHGVDLDLLEPLTTAEMASNLERGEWTLVHNAATDASLKGHSAARIGLFNSDASTCLFLPPKDMQRKAVNSWKLHHAKAAAEKT